MDLSNEELLQLPRLSLEELRKSSNDGSSSANVSIYKALIKEKYSNKKHY